MKKLEQFRPLDEILVREDLNRLHLKVSKVAELADFPEQAVAVFIDDDGEFQNGDIVVNDGGNWVKMGSLRAAIGNVSMLRGYMIGTKVLLRWKEPIDTFNSEGKCIARWEKTVVVRKYGSAPTSINDGTICYTSYIRDQFHQSGSPYFIDYAPIADGGDWYYGVYAVADNGKPATGVTLKVAKMPWSDIAKIIREGDAAQLFAVGDIIQFKDGNELVVASIDTCKAANETEHPHTVTFMFRDAYQIVMFDRPKGLYFRTKDAYARQGKVYYRPTGQFNAVGDPIYEVLSIPTGSQLPAGIELYETNDPDRAYNGSNRWSSSDLRDWLNSVTISGNADRNAYMAAIREHNGITDPAAPVSPYRYLKEQDPDLIDAIIPTQCITKEHQVDGGSSSITNDLFFIPSITEVTGEPVLGIYEGTQFQIYGDDPTSVINYAYLSENAIKILTASGWWTRTAVQSGQGVSYSNCAVRYVTSTGNTEVTSLLANSYTGCVVAFNIG